MLPLKARATFVLVSLCVFFVLCAVSASIQVLSLSFNQELQPLLVTQEFELMDLERGDLINSISPLVDLAYAIAFVLSMVALMMWVHRINRSLISAGIQNMSASPGWSVGWYFIPIASIWKPVTNMRETWRAASFLAETDRTGYWSHARVGSLVGWWWAVWIVSLGLGGVSGHAYADIVEIEERILANKLAIVSYVFDAASMILTAILVSRLTSMHDRAATIDAAMRGDPNFRRPYTMGGMGAQR